MTGQHHTGIFERRVRALVEGFRREFPPTCQRVLFGGRETTLAEVVAALEAMEAIFGSSAMKRHLRIVQSGELGLCPKPELRRCWCAHRRRLHLFLSGRCLWPGCGCPGWCEQAPHLEVVTSSSTTVTTLDGSKETSS